ncbi:uncharacterized protein UMAG_02410 [Mycosarcoma maydis]|uniref:Uncharacterized protein n=1 Tax=Mycosarcoma maydis TaxID=5270 RepID=A0A0D1E126_MYCMD|nr:uncharacterized protein UMAG_02410 [Ustilago maydis 521]KIS69894.1 hypothetical protein UMAG_02410 [Ustilago maydis 521]|eukprot:XP_011388702.1 hypothetical protein UMAG_02410 [Ustilago maydis 521]
MGSTIGPQTPDTMRVQRLEPQPQYQQCRLARYQMAAPLVIHRLAAGGRNCAPQHRVVLTEITGQRMNFATTPLSTSVIRSTRIHDATMHSKRGDRASKKRASAVQCNGRARAIQRRRNAISLTKEQARILKIHLNAPGTCTSANSLDATNHDDQRSLGTTAPTCTRIKTSRTTELPFHTLALQSNLFLVTRTDGHAFHCPRSDHSV